jgi:hypothetical protein
MPVDECRDVGAGGGAGIAQSEHGTDLGQAQARAGASRMNASRFTVCCG